MPPLPPSLAPFTPKEPNEGPNSSEKWRGVTLHINTCALHNELPVRGDGEDAISGAFGLGSERTLEQWYAHCGVDFSTGVIGERAKMGGQSEGALVGLGC